MTDKTKRPPKENLVRAIFPGPEFRDDNAPEDGFLGTITGYGAVWNQWTEIDSAWEGNFLERIAPGAFDKALQENVPKLLFQHGRDPQIGDKPLGPVRLNPDKYGLGYEGDLLDTSYNRDLYPGLKAGLYGSSFRFSVMKEDFNRAAGKSAYNPNGLPERTIREATLPELGPVTFPAYLGATAGARSGVRSMTDDFILTEALDQFIEHPDKLRALIEQRSIQKPERANALPTDGAAAGHSDEGSRSEPPAQPPDPPVEPEPTPPTPPESGVSVRSNTVNNTIEDRRSRIAEINARFTEVQAEYGVDVLPDAIQSEWDTLAEERATHEKAISAFETRSAQLATAATNERSVERVGETTQKPTRTTTNLPANIYAVEEYRNVSSSPEQEKRALNEGAMRAVEIANFPHERADEAANKKHISELLASDEDGRLARHILSTGNPTYQRAFGKTLAGRMLSTEEQRAIMTVGTTTTGGFAIPFHFDPTLILTSDGNVNPLRQMARVERITGAGNTWKGVSTAGITITRGPAEMQPVTPTEVTLAQPEVTVQPVKVEIQFSIEADEDWPGLQTQLARVLQDAKDDEEANSFVNGVGTTVFPAGVVETLDASSEVGTTGDGLDVSDLYRLEGALGSRYTARAQFLAHRAVYAAIRQFSVGATGEGSVWVRGLAAGDPPSLLGYPARQISTMEADYTTDGNRVVLFGDFNNFLIVDKVGMTIEIDPHVRDGNGKWVGARALLAHYRNSSVILNHNAFRVLTIGVVTS